MNDKSTLKNIPTQVHLLPAGVLPGDKSTELFGCRESKKVFGLSNGHTIPFQSLCPDKRAAIFQKMLGDDIAMADLKDLPHEAALEQFAFCVFGAADNEADFDCDGNLGKADNFICSDNCRCLAWRSKSITIDGQELTPRQVQIIQKMASDKPNKQIAGELGISESTLDTHARHIYEKFNVNSKAGMITKAVTQKVIQ
ncbi:MAG: LuxR family transcriptional regulator [Chryseobacterium sp.]|nr:MAG: LuxR family transcriptional regulator [Chryseobacterium sp.]